MENKPTEIQGTAPDGALFRFYKVDFVDKLVVGIVVDGVMDALFDLPLSTLKVIDEGVMKEDSLGVEPVVLVGDPQNLKLQVVAGQIGKVIYSLGNRKNVILSMGLRWWGRDTEEGDFDKLVFVLEKVRALVGQGGR